MKQRLLLIITVLLATHGPAFSEGVGHSLSGTSATRKTNPSPIAPSELSGIQHSVDRIATALQATNYKPQSPEEKENAKRNLAAQEKLSFWAPLMFLVGLAEVLLTGVGIYLISRTLKATWAAANEAKRAADAARDSVAQSEQFSKQELRAYLSIEPVGIRRLIASTDGIGQVSVHNVGKVPAKDVSVFVNMRLSGDRDTVFDVIQDRNEVQRVIQPGASMRQGSENYLPITEITNPGKNIFVFGVVYYGDGFGQRRFTRFCHRYGTASYDRLWQRKDNPAEIIIEVEKARYHTHGNDAD